MISWSTSTINVRALSLCKSKPLRYLKVWKGLLKYCKGDGNVHFTRPFLILCKVTFDEHVNVLDRYHKSDISYTLTKP